MSDKLKPFIIWTLQRTGGTNLTQRLVELSGLPSTQHEPFNLGRIHGEITQAWMDTHDEAALMRAMLGVATQGAIIKHCLEMVPWEVTRALARATVQAGYRHLFLYREQARNRLLSLHFAQKTGVWGPNMRKGDIPEEDLREVIPIERMLRHEEMCVTHLGQTWRFLIEQGARPMALSYEALYRAERDAAERRLQPLLEMLGLSRSPQKDHAFVQEVLGKGDQGTRDKYDVIPGIAELEEALKGLPVFVPEMPASAFSIERAEMPQWVVRAQIDSLPQEVPEGRRFLIGGVVVVEQEAPEGLVLHLAGSNRTIDIQWGIESQKMKKLYPDAKNSGCARFRSAEITYAPNKEYALQVCDAQGNVYPLFRVLVS
jgi:LPS sulfotransferase NodH